MFSKIDLAEENVRKMAFWTRHGHYEFVTMSFQVTNEPTTFIKTMKNVFLKYFDKCVIFFINGILVNSRTKGEHKLPLRIVMNNTRITVIFYVDQV